jgi:hypothetical protein
MTSPILRNHPVLATVAFVAGWIITTAAQAAPNACGLLTDVEAAKLIARGQPDYSEREPTTVAGGKGSLCQYDGGQVGLWTGPGSGQSFEQFLASWKQDKEPRQPVAGVGDQAYVFYPKPRNSYTDEGPMLVATVGAHTVTAALFARKGQASGLMGDVCRGNQNGLSEKEKKECVAVLADQGEKPESLQPAVTELAKVLVAKVRSGNLGQ